MFQTELVYGIICNIGLSVLIFGLILFQTELVYGIICNYFGSINTDFTNLVSNRVGLWYNLQPIVLTLYILRIHVSNRVGLWYNLQQNKFFDLVNNSIKFQTELVYGIICNLYFCKEYCEILKFQTELVYGIICNISKENYHKSQIKFQTELVYGIICNSSKFNPFYGYLVAVKGFKFFHF